MYFVHSHVSPDRAWNESYIDSYPIRIRFPLDGANHIFDKIEKILGHRRKRSGDYVYLVKWKGYSYEESTWEPASNFKPHTLRDYHLKRKREKEEDSGTDSSDEDERTQ